MTFYKSTESATLSSSNAATINRGVYGSIANADAGLTFAENGDIPDNTINGYEYVDLGLPSGLKWASCNVGATKPEDYGDYFAWGETEPKEYYYWSTYKWCNGDYDKLTKYCTYSSYWDSSNPMDNKTVLDLEDDAARANWGGSWRMPTDAEWEELIYYCTWTLTSDYNGTGIMGQEVTASNGNSIFLPTAGFRYDTYYDDVGFGGRYWSSSLGTYPPTYAWGVDFNYSGVYGDSQDGDRDHGLSVRPVSE